MITERNPELLTVEINAATARLSQKAERVAREMERELPTKNSLLDDYSREIGHIVREVSTFLLGIPRLPLPEGLPQHDRSLTNLTLHANALQRQVNRWGNVETLVRLQNPIVATPLYEEAPKAHENRFQQTEASDALFVALHNLIRSAEQSENAREHGCFPDIPLGQNEFFQHIHAARRVLLADRGNVHTRFLDVGCGVGVKVLAAARLFHESVGLEFDPTYATLANAVVAKAERRNADVIRGDGLTFEGYDGFDVIYFYRPMRDEKTLFQLETAIAETARPGTILIAPYPMFASSARLLNAAHITGRLFLAKSDQAQADALREKAQRIGSAPLEFDRFKMPIWEPILQSSLRHGFSLPRF